MSQLDSRNWFGKACAGVILGLLLAIGIAGLILNFGFGDIYIFSIQGQFLMWLVAPLWACILSFCFLFRTGFTAWVWLGAINSVIWIAVSASPLQG